MGGDLILVEAESRWDAVDLARRLARHHTYLVQLGNRRWNVCVPPDHGLRDGELLASVRDEARRWAGERRLETVLRAGGHEYAVHG